MSVMGLGVTCSVPRSFFFALSLTLMRADSAVAGVFSRIINIYIYMR